jgi:hypothetical protein
MFLFPKGCFREKLWILVMVFVFGAQFLKGQQAVVQDSVLPVKISTGWADQAVSTGTITAPSVLVLMFVSGLVNEWNAGYSGIPASVMILAAPPVIFLGGRSVGIRREEFLPRAKLGWTLYVLSVIPTAFALYSFTTDWGAAVPLIISSGILGSASIIAMTSYAFSREEAAKERNEMSSSSWSIGLTPVRKGAMLTLSCRF